MTRNPYRNAAQDPEVMASNAKDQQQASPEAIAQWRERNASMAPPYVKPNGQIDRARINAALAEYEESRLGERPKPKFILTAVRSALELAALIGGLAAIVGVLIVLTAIS